MTSGSPQTILLDIEGTTTPLNFVHQVLFPYAQAHVEDFLRRRSLSPEVRTDLESLCEEHLRDVRQGLGPPPIDGREGDGSGQRYLAYLRWLMDHDRKSTALKSIQGKLWEEGYRRGALQGRVFADVPSAFQRWRRMDIRLFIFSSGSVLAQKLLFAHSEAGDLTGYLSGYFDTTIGAKVEADSYRAIAQLLERPAPDILFVSDAPREVLAATAAGMKVAFCARPGNAAPPPSVACPVVESFDALP
jgi:enolase-phosphatase E1